MARKGQRSGKPRPKLAAVPDVTRSGSLLVAKSAAALAAQDVKSQDLAPTPTPRLFILNVEQNEGSPTIRFTWSLEPKAIELLVQDGIFHPFLLVSVFKKDSGTVFPILNDVSRQLLPLSRGFGVIDFSESGNFLICASIVLCNSNPRVKASAYDGLSYLVTKNKNGGFNTRLHDMHKYVTWEGESHRFLYSHEQVSVSVSSEFFAAKPPEWLWRYANLWHERTPDDQCMLRRRALLSILKTIPVLMYLFAIPILRGFIGLVAVSFGIRDVNWKVLVHPFDMTTDDIGRGNLQDKNMWWIKTTKSGKDHSELFQYVARPIYHVGVAVVSIVIAVFYRKTEPVLLLNFFCWYSVIAAMLLSILFVVEAVQYVRECLDRLKATQQLIEEEQKGARLAAKRKEAVDRTQIEQLYAERFKPLLVKPSEAVPSTAVFTALPKSHRTLLLWYEDTKAKVCKPFPSFRH